MLAWQVNVFPVVNVICPSRRDIIRGTQSSAPRWVRGQEGGPGCAGGHAPPRPCLRVWAPPQGPVRTPAVSSVTAQSRQQPPRPAAAAGRHRGQWRHQGRGHRRLLGRRGAVHIRAASGGAHVLETRQQDVPRDARRLWWPLTISHCDPADASQAVAVAGGHTGHWKGGGGLRYVASKSHQTLLCTQKIYIDNDRYVWKDLYYHWFGLISFQAYRRITEVCKYGSHRISPCLRQ